MPVGDSAGSHTAAAGNCLVVFVTAETEDEALRIARLLVGEKLAACVNIVNGVRSVYRWEGEVAEGRESLLIVKTTHDRLDALQLRIRELHSYELPEIIALPILGGSDAYLNWLADSTR